MPLLVSDLIKISELDPSKVLLILCQKRFICSSSAVGT